MFSHRLLGGCSSRLSVSCQSPVSALIAAVTPVSGAPGGVLNPLSSCTPKQWSLAS